MSFPIDRNIHDDDGSKPMPIVIGTINTSLKLAVFGSSKEMAHCARSKNLSR